MRKVMLCLIHVIDGDGQILCWILFCLEVMLVIFFPLGPERDNHSVNISRHTYGY